MSPKTLGVIMIIVGVVFTAFHRQIARSGQRNNMEMVGRPLVWNSPGFVLFAGIGLLIFGLINLLGLYSWFPG